MKKMLIILTFILFTGSAYAGSCPMMAKTLDSKIEEASKMRSEFISTLFVKMLAWVKTNLTFARIKHA